jgi:hypothetical protein
MNQFELNFEDDQVRLGGQSRIKYRHGLVQERVAVEMNGFYIPLSHSIDEMRMIQ